MLTLLKNIECYCPQYCGKKDILMAGTKIYKITSVDELKESSLVEKTFFCDGLLAFPGLIDQHVHIIGGGGEQGFQSRAMEIFINEILMAGVTTLVGLLGADGYTRSLECLYAKAKQLEAQGTTTFIYSGSYALPAITITNNIISDLIFIDKVIGAGEIAISDHRSSQPDLKEILKLSSDTHLGGMIGGKAGVVHLHVGDGKMGLNMLHQVLGQSDLPMEMFVPTHTNRSHSLFDQAMDYCRSGGNIDITAGELVGLPVPQAVRMLVDGRISLSRVTVSSDANGCNPDGGVIKIQALYDDLKKCIISSGIKPEIVFQLATENVAKILKLYPRKGALKPGSDADILITDDNYNVKMLFGMGRLLVENGLVI